MKKWSLIIGLAALLCIGFSAQTMAAPGITTAARYQYFSGHFAGIEVGLELTPGIGLTATALTLVNNPFAVSILTIGGRYYFWTDQIRPFVSLQGGAVVAGAAAFFGMGTVGLEYRHPTGFRVGAEAGCMYWGSLNFTATGFVGYAF